MVAEVAALAVPFPPDIRPARIRADQDQGAADPTLDARLAAAALTAAAL